MIVRVFTALALSLVLVPAAHAGGRTILIGAAEDAAKQPDLAYAKTKMDLAVLAGFNAVRLTAQWKSGMTSLPDDELLRLKNAATAAQLDGIRPIVAIYNTGNRNTPLTAGQRRDFATFAAWIARNVPTTDVIIGNEPNLNLFWMPQFTKQGKDAAAPAFYSLLAQTYDAVKAVSKRIRVIGIGLSPRGGDNAKAPRPTHSPTTFIKDLAATYKKAKRKKPIMDVLAFHPYQQKSNTPPLTAHPKEKNITVGDYARLQKLLATSFKGTKQMGANLPILYAEFGIQSEIPTLKEGDYTNLQLPESQDAVPEDVQAEYYREAISAAYCQKNVIGIMLFHVSDEPDGRRWQSGLFYADDTPKSGLDYVRKSIGAVRAGSVRCGAGHVITGKPSPRTHPLTGVVGTRRAAPATGG